MRLDEIRLDWSGFADHAKQQEEAGLIYDVVVANPRLGSYAEAKNLPYRKARRRMVDLANKHFGEIFRQDAQNAKQEWQNYDAIKVTWATTGAVTFYFLRDVSKKK